MANRAAGPFLEWGVVISTACLVIGVYLDGWAHIRGLPESFFTPWHATIYGAFGATALILIGAWILGRRAGYARREALPAGYGLSLVGVGIFLIAGVGDFVWHSLFGIEANLEALYSPPHLLLAGGGALMATGPLRAAWKRDTSSVPSCWRAVLSATFLLALLTFFTSELHPFVHPWAWVRFRPRALSPGALELPPLAQGGVGTQDLAATLGVGSFVLQSALLCAVVLLLVRRWGVGLPYGWLTSMLALHTAGLSIFHWTPWTVPVAIIAGVISDSLYHWLKPRVEAPLRVRLLSTFLPMTLFACYFVALFIQGGVWWSIHVWMGAIVLAATTGWLVSYLVVPPAFPQEASAVRGRGAVLNLRGR